MTLSEIKEVLRHLPPDQLREVLVEFLPEVLTPLTEQERTALDVAAGVMADREDLLRRLARR